jgi:hypothetical protein
MGGQRSPQSAPDAQHRDIDKSIAAPVSRKVATIGDILLAGRFPRPRSCARWQSC